MKEVIINSWYFQNTYREIYESESLPEDDTLIWCCFWVCLTSDWKKVCLMNHHKRWREHPWWTREVWESIKSCLLREIQEEAGLEKFIAKHYIWVRKFIWKEPYFLQFSQKETLISYCVVYLMITNEIPNQHILNHEDTLESKYFSIEEAVSLLTRWNKSLLEMALRKHASLSLT